MRALRLALVVVRVTMMNDLHYRANLFFALLQSVLSLVTGLLVLALVFARVPRLHGWSYPQLLAVLGVFMVLGAYIRMVLKPNLLTFMADVRDGTLDYILVKPSDAQFLVSFRTLNVWHGVDGILGAGVLAGAFASLGLRGGAVRIAAFTAAMLLSFTIMYCFLFMLSTAAFWFIDVKPIVELFDGIYQSGRWPLGIYPSWMRVGLIAVAPVGLAVTVPAEAVGGGLSALVLGGTALFALAMLAVTRLVWRAALRRYSGASA